MSLYWYVYMQGLLTCFSSPGLLLQGHQQGGEDQFYPVGTQVPHYSLGTVICSLEKKTTWRLKL